MKIKHLLTGGMFSIASLTPAVGQKIHLGATCGVQGIVNYKIFMTIICEKLYTLIFYVAK